MINVRINEPNFEYDIHSLVKAFYASEDVKVACDLCGVEYVQENGWPEEVSIVMDLNYNEDNIAIMLLDKANPGNISIWTEEHPADIDRPDKKNVLKQALYKLLSTHTGKKLPWGTLTGIRPTKIPMAMLENGQSEEDVIKYMQDTYFASDEKIHLGLDVAKRELELLSKLDYEDGYSLYIGIPFCPSTCLYCSFTSYPLVKWASRMDEYLDGLFKEIDFTAKACKDKYLNSIYIGGGTPTTLNPDQLDRLINKVGEAFGVMDDEGRIIYGDNHLIEFTVEGGRPDSITREKLEVLKKHNISRISINPQTMKDETLKLIGRHHTVAQTVDAFKLARELGFDNINMDLIIGLPNESIDDVRDTMEAIKELAPDNVTVHSLAIKRAARLNMNWDDYKTLSIEATEETIDLTARYCREMGLTPYYLYRQKNMAGNFENVGYAAPSKAGVYNILIMEEKQTIIALGAGATTKFVFENGTRIERVSNVKDITNYLDRVDEMIERKHQAMIEYGLIDE